MRKKNVIIIILSALIFLSAAALGVSTVYRVSAVTVDCSVVSDEAKAEADAIEAKLQAAYDKQSMFSVGREEANMIIKEFPYFRITAFTKSYPNRLIVSLSEDAEVYVVPKLDSVGEYYILNEDNVILGIRKDTKNRSDKAENLPIYGLNAKGAVGLWLEGDDCLATLFPFLKTVSKSLDGIRRNVSSVEVIRRAALEEETVFKLSMREGVNVYVRNPAALTEQKAETAINAYLSLSSTQKLKGMIMISDVNGEIVHAYSETDAFA